MAAAATTMAEDERKIAVFAFGSNGTAQLRSRCKNDALVSYKAAIHDYRRFFAGNSAKWGGGGVASLAPAAGVTTRGSVVYLTEAELQLLDPHEGIPKGVDPTCTDFSKCRYARTRVTVDVWRDSGESKPETVPAIAYIRNKTDWEGMPSVTYFQACVDNLAPFWPDYDGDGALHVYDGTLTLRARFQNGAIVPVSD